MFTRWWKCSLNEAKAQSIWCSTAREEDVSDSLNLIKSPCWTHASLWKWICVLTRANSSVLFVYPLTTAEPGLSTSPRSLRLRQDPTIRPCQRSKVWNLWELIWLQLQNISLCIRITNWVVCAWAHSALLHCELQADDLKLVLWCSRFMHYVRLDILDVGIVFFSFFSFSYVVF